jgi:hypothetical protein
LGNAVNRNLSWRNGNAIFPIFAADIERGPF